GKIRRSERAMSAAIERLIIMSDRLSTALEADIVALQNGNLHGLRATAADIQQLSALFTREAVNVSPQMANAAPKDLRDRLTKSTKRFHDALKLHARLVTRMRNCSEGMIRAVAEEIERQRQPIRTYAPPRAARTDASSALVYNAVI